MTNSISLVIYGHWFKHDTELDAFPLLYFRGQFRLLRQAETAVAPRTVLAPARARYSPAPFTRFVVTPPVASQSELLLIHGQMFEQIISASANLTY